MGPKISLNCPELEARLAGRHPVFAFPPEVRKILYTANAIERLNRVIRETTKTRGSFLTDDAATKLIYLAIRSFESKGKCVRQRGAARNE